MFCGIASKIAILSKKSKDVTYLYNEGINESAWVVGYSIGNGTQSKASTSLIINVDGDSERTYVTDTTINLTNFTKIGIDIFWSQFQPSAQPYLIISTDKMSNSTVYTTRFDGSSMSSIARTAFLFNINLSGNYYVRLHASHIRPPGMPSERGTAVETATYKIWLE
jgi:hypothetical protein